MEDVLTKTERNLESVKNALELCLKLIKEMNQEFEAEVKKL